VLSNSPCLLNSSKIAPHAESTSVAILFFIMCWCKL
jgi:hypothetical protein